MRFTRACVLFATAAAVLPAGANAGTGTGGASMPAPNVPSGGTAVGQLSAPPPSAPARRARLSNGKAVAPRGAPLTVRRVIAAGNRLQGLPYRYGGGHASVTDTAYDCSGTVSFALHGGKLLAAPLDSTGFETWGAAGRGRWITVYANAGHAYMTVAGLRLDTSGTNGSGPRWQVAARSGAGFVARHPAGL